MRALIASLLLVAFAAAWADGADPKDRLFAGWQRTQRDVRSLVVEFTREMPDKVFNTTQKDKGTFRLVCSPQREILASYELWCEDPAAMPPIFAGLLDRRTVYALDHRQKLEFRLKMAEKDLPGFLEQYFNPLVILLDRGRAEEKCELELKEGEFYTHLSVKPKQVKKSRGFFSEGFFGNFSARRITVMNRNSKTIPKDMPRQLWFAIGHAEFTFDIKTWRMNAADGPKADDLARPESSPGWKVQVSEWPLKR